MNIVTLTGINQRMDAQYSKSGTAWVRGAIRVRNTLQNAEGKYESSFINYKVLGKRAETFACLCGGTQQDLSGLNERAFKSLFTKRDMVKIVEIGAVREFSKSVIQLIMEETK